jgi:5-methylcytosine-specific restriction endonuclease McrA
VGNNICLRNQRSPVRIRPGACNLETSLLTVGPTVGPSAPAGRPSTSPHRQYHRDYQRQWIADRRQEWIDAHGPCACGSTDGLEVDHIDPEQKAMEVSAIWSRRAEVRAVELDKCQVLCRPCHEKKTFKDRHVPRQHGTVRMYKRGKCRCAECRQANTDYRRQLKINSGVLVGPRRKHV